MDYNYAPFMAINTIKWYGLLFQGKENTKSERNNELVNKKLRRKTFTGLNKYDSYATTCGTKSDGTLLPVVHFTD